MHYLIDGYNLFFRLTKNYAEMNTQKRDLLFALSKELTAHRLQATLVFDGREKAFSYALRKHLADLELIYTPAHQSADAYILEEVERAKAPSQLTVVSSDREVIGRAKQYGANILTIEAFLSLLFDRRKKKKERNQEEKEVRESPKEIERLRKIFEADK